jgi:Domain of unknown function (DUF4389)
MSEQAPSVPAETSPPHPIRLVVTDDLRRNRLTVFFRLLLVIPHLIWLTLWTLVSLLLAFVGWIVAIFMGRLPDGIHNFLAGNVRYATHVYAYWAIAADPFPGFLGQPGYPVDAEIDPPAQQNRLTIIFRWILAIPALIVTSVLQYVLQIVAILAWFYALFTGRASEGMRNLQAYCLRYQAQTYGYVWLLTGRYPSFGD